MEQLPSRFCSDEFARRFLHGVGGVHWTLKNPDAIRPPERPLSSEMSDEESEKQSKHMQIDDLRQKSLQCRACRLCENRTHVVFGSGDIHASIMIIGEGPGAEEDQQGLPFVGKSGQLLTLILKSVRIRREQCYIANIVKCRPPGNRDPWADEVQACIHLLKQQVQIIQPRLLVTLGLVAAQTILNTHQPLSALRGKKHQWMNIPLITTYHPAYLLRSPSQKKAAYLDWISIVSQGL